jgi:hypothetical protein
VARSLCAIEQEAGIPGTVACQTPEWVAARLWDRSPLVNTDHKAALREWVDRWVAMGAPTLVPSRAWSPDFAKVFLDNALDVLGPDAVYLNGLTGANTSSRNLFLPTGNRGKTSNVTWRRCRQRPWVERYGSATIRSNNRLWKHSSQAMILTGCAAGNEAIDA